jgi:hypothetical protein
MSVHMSFVLDIVVADRFFYAYLGFSLLHIWGWYGRYFVKLSHILPLKYHTVRFEISQYKLHILTPDYLLQAPFPFYRDER